MSEKVLVTGANGHIGANLTRKLLGLGMDVRALVHHRNDALQALDIDLVHGDIRDKDAVDQAVKGCSVVFHLAAKITILSTPDPTVDEINVGGTRNVATACLAHGVRRLVHCSSTHALDQHTDGALTETQPLAAMDTPPYDRSKSQAEGIIQQAIQNGLDAVIINPCAVIGPHDFAPSRMGRVLLDLAQKKMPALIDGAYTFVDSRDVCEGALLALEKGKTGERYLITGHYLTIKALAGIAESVTGVRSPRFTSPWWMARMGVPFSELYARVTKTEPLFTSVSLDVLRQPPASHDKATRELGYNPRPMEETVRDTYDWFRQAGTL